MKKERELNTLDVLTSMSEAQSKQFQHATLLAIGIAMKKLGLDTLEITEADLSTLTRDDKIGVERGINGTLVYRLTTNKKH